MQGEILIATNMPTYLLNYKKVGIGCLFFKVYYKISIESIFKKEKCFIFNGN